MKSCIIFNIDNKRLPFLMTSFFFFLFISTAKSATSKAFDFQNEFYGFALLLNAIFCMLITAYFKTLIRLKWDKKYIAIPKEKRKIIIKKSKKWICILIVFVILTSLLFLLNVLHNNWTLFFYKFLIPAFALFGLINESESLNKALAEVSKKSEESEFEKKIEIVKDIIDIF